MITIVANLKATVLRIPVRAVVTLTNTQSGLSVEVIHATTLLGISVKGLAEAQLKSEMGGSTVLPFPSFVTVDGSGTFSQ